MKSDAEMEYVKPRNVTNGNTAGTGVLRMLFLRINENKITNG
jgi:hypothetical protein